MFVLFFGIFMDCMGMLIFDFFWDVSEKYFYVFEFSISFLKFDFFLYFLFVMCWVIERLGYFFVLFLIIGLVLIIFIILLISFLYS